MGIVRKPFSGSSDKPYKSSQVWSQVIDTVNAVQSGRYTNPAPMAGAIQIMGEAYEELEAGTLVAINSTIGGGNQYGGNETLILPTEEVQWHSNLNRVAIAQTDAKAKGAAIQFFSSPWCYAKMVDDSWGIGEGESMKLYAMPDPENPKYLRPAASGIYEIVSYAGYQNKLAVVNIYKSQPYWRYKLDESFGETTEGEARAQLIDIEGQPFETGSTTIITDREGLMDDQSAGDEGICLQAGSKFHAIQANCS